MQNAGQKVKNNQSYGNRWQARTVNLDFLLELSMVEMAEYRLVSGPDGSKIAVFGCVWTEIWRLFSFVWAEIWRMIGKIHV